MKKILITESEKKAIISEREKAIIANFAKTFNSIKRINENELTEERPISARYGADPTPEQSAGIDTFVKTFLDKLQQVLSPEEIQFLSAAYTKGGKEVVAKAIDDTTNKSTNEDSNTEPPAEGDMGMSRNEIKLRQILDKIITTGALGSMAGIIPAAMAGAPAVALGLGIAALVGSAMKDAAWWKSKGHHYGGQSKYGVKENDGEDYERQSREVEYGINPYQEQPDMDSIKLDTMKQHLEWLESMIMNYDRAMMYDKKDEVEQQYYQLRNEISNLEQGNQLPF